MTNDLTTTLRKAAAQLDEAVEAVTGAEARNRTAPSDPRNRRALAMVAAAAAVVLVVIGATTLFDRQDDTTEIGPADTTTPLPLDEPASEPDEESIAVLIEPPAITTRAPDASAFAVRSADPRLATLYDFDGQVVGGLESTSTGIAARIRAIAVDELTAPTSFDRLEPSDRWPLLDSAGDDCIFLMASASGAIEGCGQVFLTLFVHDGSERRPLLEPPPGSAFDASNNAVQNGYQFVDLSPDGRYLLAEWTNLSTDDLGTPFDLREPSEVCVGRKTSLVVDVVSGEVRIIGARGDDWRDADDYRAIGWTLDGRAIVQELNQDCPLLSVIADQPTGITVATYAVDRSELTEILTLPDVVRGEVIAVIVNEEQPGDE